MSIETVSLLLVVIVAIFTSITAPLMLAHRTEKMHTADREADWKRQDEVANKAAQAAADLATNQQKIAAVAAEAARLLLEKQGETTRAQQEVAVQAAEAARLLLANNERVAEIQELTNGKLDVIHVLVNSNMTAAMQGEMDATIREVALMTELLQLKKAAGLAPTVEALAAIDAANAKIKDLRLSLADRLEAAAEAAKLNPGPGIITITTTAKPGHDGA